MRTARFPHVDALRAIAALCVLGTHAAVFAGADAAGSASGHYAQRLEVGVSIFFVISGFLLYRPFAAARASGTPAPLTGPYAWRRVLRIVPAYWLALTVSAVVLGTAGVFTANGVPTFYALGQGYRESTIGGGLTQAWSLTIEVAFYAFLPLWAWAMRRLPGRSLRGEALALAALAAASLVYKLAVLAPMDPAQVRITPWLIGLPAYLDQFAIGMGLAVLTLREHPLPRLGRHAGLGWLVAAAAFWVVSTQVGLGDRLFEPVTPAQYVVRHLLYALIAAGMVLPAVLPGGGAVRRVLSNRVLAWLGMVSYGIFLWHLTVLSLLDRAGFASVAPVHPYLAWPVAALGLTAVVAAASWYGLERPALSLKRLAPRTRAAAPAVAPAER
jgi:peptidoglycan/LPS O-acetylase OafA/YrhL